MCGGHLHYCFLHPQWPRDHCFQNNEFWSVNIEEGRRGVLLWLGEVLCVCNVFLALVWFGLVSVLVWFGLAWHWTFVLDHPFFFGAVSQKYTVNSVQGWDFHWGLVVVNQLGYITMNANKDVSGCGYALTCFLKSHVHMYRVELHEFCWVACFLWAAQLKRVSAKL